MRPNDDVSRLFSANLKKQRRLAQMSQEELAIRASLHRTEVGYLERQIRIPRIDTLVKLAGSLEVDVSDLLEGIEWLPGDLRRGGFKVGDSN